MVHSTVTVPDTSPLRGVCSVKGVTLWMGINKFISISVHVVGYQNESREMNPTQFVSPLAAPPLPSLVLGHLSPFSAVSTGSFRFVSSPYSPPHLQTRHPFDLDVTHALLAQGQYAASFSPPFLLILRSRRCCWTIKKTFPVLSWFDSPLFPESSYILHNTMSEEIVL